MHGNYNGKFIHIHTKQWVETACVKLIKFVILVDKLKEPKVPEFELFINWQRYLIFCIIMYIDYHPLVKKFNHIT